MGRHKLYPAVSPNKTWEGSIGGVLAAAAGAAVIKVLLLPEIGWLHIMMLAVPGAILGQIGDLAESLIKRSVGVKDSGALLPGHGGILDRVDAVLFIAPYVFLYVVIVLL
jgi:phosphatidate cytidylyltransferase